ncbi:unnamed protein product [Miscanthus lutarioriparius]|uniref:Protein kinase domain-containing protein n=1 Tax=Miscanthus lutarioriparius TaxID=422564 RepID=A0A811MKF8_9POAL|nr:unnamed protein product [Miscanthus lutarioriparius]
MDQYEVLEQIGKGAFGSAVLVRHKLERKKSCVEKDPSSASDRPHSPMQLIATVRNPFIVEYKDSWVDKKLCQWLVQFLMALDYLHAHHILHRDVKCSNIFLTRDQNIRLGDFGLAKILTADDLASSVVGTPTYMCPELLADIPYGTKSDIWSLGCCMYEMTALKPAFKAFDMQALINKITKSIVSPLPTRYSGAFRGLVRSMLRRSPEHMPSAAELLKHPHLQPYVLQVHLKSQPSRSIIPVHQSPSEKRMTFAAEPVCRSKGRRNSLGCERIVTCSTPSPDKNSISSISSIKDYITTQSVKELSVDDSQVEGVTSKPVASRTPNIMKTPKATPWKMMTTLRNRLEAPQASYDRTSHTEFSRTPVDNRHSHLARRASLPLPVFETPNPKRSSMSILEQLESPDVSVNSPRIDRIAEFPLASWEDPERRRRRRQRLVLGSRHHGGVEPRVLGVVAPETAAEGAVRHTTSYQQRAEALEGLLEFSAQLLQQEWYEELGVLPRPFGPDEKVSVSPRETPIWLTKSFKEATATGL